MKVKRTVASVGRNAAKESLRIEGACSLTFHRCILQIMQYRGKLGEKALKDNKTSTAVIDRFRLEVGVVDHSDS